MNNARSQKNTVINNEQQEKIVIQNNDSITELNNDGIIINSGFGKLRFLNQ